MDLWQWLLDLLAGPTGAALVAVGLLAVRWLVFLTVAPFPVLGEAGFVVRLALAGALAVGSLPAALPVPEGVLVPGVALALVGKEALVGFVLGAVVAFLLVAFEAAGQLVDLLRGATLSQVLVGADAGSGSPLGAFLLLSALALLVVSGGFLVLVGGLLRAVEAFPVATLPVRLLEPDDLVGSALGLFGRAWEVGLLLAAPAMGVSLLLDAALGMAARVSPGFGGYFLALPLRAVLGVGALVLSLALVRPHLAELLRTALGILGAGGS